MRGKAVVVPPDIGQLQCNMTLIVPADIVCMGVRIAMTLFHLMPISHTDNHFIRGMEGEEEFQISFLQRVALHFVICT